MEESPGERGDADGKKEVADSVGRVSESGDRLTRKLRTRADPLLFLPLNVETKDPSAWRVRLCEEYISVGSTAGQASVSVWVRRRRRQPTRRTEGRRADGTATATGTGRRGGRGYGRDVRAFRRVRRPFALCVLTAAGERSREGRERERRRWRNETCGSFHAQERVEKRDCY